MDNIIIGGIMWISILSLWVLALLLMYLAFSLFVCLIKSRHAARSDAKKAVSAAFPKDMETTIDKFAAGTKHALIVSLIVNIIVWFIS